MISAMLKSLGEWHICSSDKVKTLQLDKDLSQADVIKANAYETVSSFV